MLLKLAPIAPQKVLHGNWLSDPVRQDQQHQTYHQTIIKVSKLPPTKLLKTHETHTSNSHKIYYIVLTKEKRTINKPTWNHHRKVSLQKTYKITQYKPPFKRKYTSLEAWQNNDQGKEEQTPIQNVMSICIIYRYQNTIFCNRDLQERAKKRGSQKWNIYNNSPLCTC